MIGGKLNTQILIDRKAAQLQKQLTQWAEKRLNLLPGERLVFMLELVHGATVTFARLAARQAKPYRWSSVYSSRAIRAPVGGE